jgi:hypothetical protein
MPSSNTTNLCWIISLILAYIYIRDDTSSDVLRELLSSEDLEEQLRNNCGMTIVAVLVYSMVLQAVCAVIGFLLWVLNPWK